jgi:hypothetical protein
MAKTVYTHWYQWFVIKKLDNFCTISSWLWSENRVVVYCSFILVKTKKEAQPGTSTPFR